MREKIFLITALLFLLPNVFSNYIKFDYQSILPKISYHEVYYAIVKYNIKFPNIVFAQSLIETGHFTSDLLHMENNLFGMKYPNRRKTTSLGKSNSGYASYEKWTDSVEDYSLWQQNMLNSRDNITESEYLSLLGRVYAEDKDYVSKIKFLIYNK
jgi:flagellum-specific peptidoglycan hydrolase FlgJ